MQVADTAGTLTHITVPLIEWPAAEATRAELAAREQPRLLVVDADAAPPHCVDELEDWVRHPVDLMDVVARTTTLQIRAEARARRPVLDEHGLLWRHGRWVSIPNTQRRLVELLVARAGQLVAAAELREAYAAAGGSAEGVALKAALARVGRRLQPLALHLHTIPGRGALLEICSADGVQIPVAP